jgi:hypothetical protein
LREAMVQEGIAGLDIRDEAILEAMRTVPRHEFVPPQYLDQAYDNHPLPIGHGQTISQPYIVALMAQLANPGPEDNVLEVGTGLGYAAAVMSRMAARVLVASRDVATGARGWPQRGSAGGSSFNGRGALVQRLGLSVAALVPVELDEVVERGNEVGVVRSKRLLHGRQSLPV